MLVRRDLLDEISGFDNNFELYFEDADLCVRTHQAGYRVFFDPGIKVVHGLGQSGKKSPNKIQLIYRQSQVLFYRKHHSAMEVVLLKIYVLLKFILSRIFWVDSTFRSRIIDILLEKKRLFLHEDFYEERHG